MNENDLNFLSMIIKKYSGLVVGPEKKYLIESRLTPVAKQLGLTNLEDLISRLRAEPSDLVTAVIEAMTTNESSFFRDTRPFVQFANTILPYLLRARAIQRSIRIWSGAASTGQEPYTLAMCLEDRANEIANWHVEILATDLSQEALNRARAGVYSQFEVQRGLPAEKLLKYFTQSNDNWIANDRLRRFITFKRHNLLSDNKNLGRFDVIFLRNVLIYFDIVTKGCILNQVADMLAPDGYLFLGGTETVLGITDHLIADEELRGLYKPVK